MPALTSSSLPGLDDCEARLLYWVTPARLQHCRGVSSIMCDLAAIYAIDPPLAQVTGLLHDCAKDLSEPILIEWAERCHISFEFSFERHPIYLHAPVGAQLARVQFGLTHPAALAAITSHSCSGDYAQYNAPLAWCLRLADVLAPVRPWQGMQRLRRVLYSGALEEAAYLFSTWLIDYMPTLGAPPHPNLLRGRQELQSRLDPTLTFDFSRL